MAVLMVLTHQQFQLQQQLTEAAAEAVEGTLQQELMVDKVALV
jgi:hypothetical protein